MTLLSHRIVLAEWYRNEKQFRYELLYKEDEKYHRIGWVSMIAAGKGGKHLDDTRAIWLRKARDLEERGEDD